MQGMGPSALTELQQRWDEQTPTAFLPLSFSFPCQLRKPLIERKRRERINNCLDQLKETVVGAFHLDVSAHFYAVFYLFAGGEMLGGGQRFLFWMWYKPF